MMTGNIRSLKTHVSSRNEMIKIKKLKEILCYITCYVLGWHEVSNTEIQFDGWNVMSKCKHCGKHIIRGENGNWYRIE